MNDFKEYVLKITDSNNQEKFLHILNWVKENYPMLVPRLAWGQPSFTDHNTYIIGFSAYKNHFAFSPEMHVIKHFLKEINRAGYQYLKMVVKVNWQEPMNFQLLKEIIDYTIIDKKDCQTFWKK